MKQLIHTAITFSAILILSGCGGSSEHDFETGAIVPIEEPRLGPIFDPAAGLLPTTNSVFFNGSTDGTLNIPNASGNPVIPQLNQLDGFSTSNPIIANFGVVIDPASLIIGETVRVFEVATTSPVDPTVASITRELTSDELVAIAIGDGTTLAIVPKLPLKESTHYAVVLTSGITVQGGTPSTSSNTYVVTKGANPLSGSFAALEPLRAINNSIETQAIAFASNPALAPDGRNIVLSWSFLTQSITPVINSVLASAKAENIIVGPSGANTKTANPLLPGIADIYVGSLEVPYYLETPSTENPAATVTGHWKGAGGSPLTRFNFNPINNGNITIPVMMTVPNIGVKPDAGWPIVIFQHGITQFRSNVIGIADSLAKAGFAVIAIDLPLHGESATLSDGVTPNPFFAGAIEPTFNVDLLNETTGETGPDGIVDSSGSSFINLQNLLASRDNPRQGVSNLLTLRRSLTNIQPANLIDSSRVGFIAHSLGGIVGTTYLGVETMPMASSIVTAGGSISDVLKNSERFGPRIIAGLAAAEVTGDAAVASYFQAAQMIIDAADPVNFAAAAAATHPIHLIEVLGDKVVPNVATEKLAALMRSSAISATTNNIAPGKSGLVRFIKGDHSSILSPQAGLDVTTEIQMQLAVFQISSGTIIQITDGNVIQ